MPTTHLTGDCLDILASLDAKSIQCCVTSPPYYGLRNYGVDGQIGLEQSPDEYVAKLVAVFREVRRVLRDDGTVWLNLGDCYATSPAGNKPGTMKSCSGLPNSSENLERRSAEQQRQRGYGDCKPKDLLGIPWRVVFALQADGWYLRSAIVWHKKVVMPESVRDRPTSSYEHVFLLSKQEYYYYNQEAIREPAAQPGKRAYGCKKLYDANGHKHMAKQITGTTRNCRNVWTINPKPFKGAHFATMPPELAERCILAGSRVGDTILDPFGGAGTTAVAAVAHGRAAVLIELNPDYVEIAKQRLAAA